MLRKDEVENNVSDISCTSVGKNGEVFLFSEGQLTREYRYCKNTLSGFQDNVDIMEQDVKQGGGSTTVRETK